MLGYTHALFPELAHQSLLLLSLVPAFDVLDDLHVKLFLCVVELSDPEPRLHLHVQECVRVYRIPTRPLLPPLLRLTQLSLRVLHRPLPLQLAHLLAQEW